MTPLVAAWAEVTFVVATLVVGAALLLTVGRRRLGDSGWLLGAAMLFVVTASSGGAAAWIEIELLTRTGASGTEIWRAKHGLRLWPVLGCAAFFAVLSLWRAKARRRMAMLLVLGSGLAGVLHFGDRLARERAFLAAVDLQPPGFPARLSGAGPNPRTVPLPSHIAAREVTLGTTIDERGYERPRACVGSRDGVWCFPADEDAPQVERVMGGDVSGVAGRRRRHDLRRGGWWRALLGPLGDLLGLAVITRSARVRRQASSNLELGGTPAALRRRCPVGA